MVSPGLDLELSFSQALQGLGLSPEAARLLWLPLPMLLVLVAAVVGVLVSVWLERKISAAVQQRIGAEDSWCVGVVGLVVVVVVRLDGTVSSFSRVSTFRI